MEQQIDDFAEQDELYYPAPSETRSSQPARLIGGFAVVVSLVASACILGAMVRKGIVSAGASSTNGAVATANSVNFAPTSEILQEGYLNYAHDPFSVSLEERKAAFLEILQSTWAGKTQSEIEHMALLVGTCENQSYEPWAVSETGDYGFAQVNIAIHGELINRNLESILKNRPDLKGLSLADLALDPEINLEMAKLILDERSKWDNGFNAWSCEAIVGQKWHN